MTSTADRRKSRWPQFRIAGLLALMAMVAIVSSAVGAGALGGMAWVVIWGFPTIAASCLALFTWPSRGAALRLLNRLILGGCVLALTQALAISLFVDGGLWGLGVTIVMSLVLCLAWLPQYALALTYFDTPTGNGLRSRDELPADWQAEVAARLAEGE